MYVEDYLSLFCLNSLKTAKILEKNRPHYLLNIIKNTDTSIRTVQAAQQL